MKLEYRTKNDLVINWINLMKKIISEGRNIEDYKEVCNIQIFFENILDYEDVFFNKRMVENITEMRKVFFSNEDNKFGHSYYNSYVGPYGSNGIGDIVDLLSENRNSKRAVLTFMPYGGGKVPCINCIQFLIRNNKLNVIYFSRGQDIFNKFVCDAICIMDMANEIAKKLKIEVKGITANISSAHIYNSDLENINQLIGKYYE